MARTKLTYGDFRPLRKGEANYSPTKRLFFSPSTGDIIPKSRFDKLAGSTAPSRQPKSTKTSTRVSPIKSERPIERPKSSRLNNYQSRVRAFSKTHGLRQSDTKRNAQFKSANQQITKRLNSLEKNEDKLRELLKEKGLGRYARFDKLNENAHKAITEAILNDQLSAKDKEVLFNKMTTIREQRRVLGNLYREIGLKDVNDYSPFGDTPTV
jgi:hypothetical protein